MKHKPNALLNELKELGLASAEFWVGTGTTVLHTNRACTTLAMFLLVEMPEESVEPFKKHAFGIVPRPMQLYLATADRWFTTVWLPWRHMWQYWKDVADIQAESFAGVALRQGLVRQVYVPRLPSIEGYRLCARCAATTRRELRGA
jgi:hypothetical protein